MPLRDGFIKILMWPFIKGIGVYHKYREQGDSVIGVKNGQLPTRQSAIVQVQSFIFKPDPTFLRVIKKYLQGHWSISSSKYVASGSTLILRMNETMKPSPIILDLEKDSWIGREVIATDDIDLAGKVVSLSRWKLKSWVMKSICD